VHLIEDLSSWADDYYAPGFLRKTVVRLAFIAPIILLGFVWINHTTHVTCLRIHEVMGLETKVVGVMLPDCFVNEDGKWKPADRLTSLELDVF
jgi:hypothetical protein